MLIKIWGESLDIEGLGDYPTLIKEIEYDTYDAMLKMQVGDYEVKREFEEGDVVLDIGAHIGLFCIPLAKKYPNIRINAYEPVPQTFDLLMRNIAANRVTNINAINKAVCASPGVLVIQHDPNRTYTSSGFYSREMPGKIKIESCAVGINEIMEPHTKIKFLKLDCEGAEWEIIKVCKHLDRVQYLGAELHIIGQDEAEQSAWYKKIADNINLPEWNCSVHEVVKEKAEGLS